MAYNNRYYLQLGSKHFGSQHELNEGIDTELKSVHMLIRQLGKMIRNDRKKIKEHEETINDQQSIIHMLSSRLQGLETMNVNIIQGGNYGNRQN